MFGRPIQNSYVNNASHRSKSSSATFPKGSTSPSSSKIPRYVRTSFEQNKKPAPLSFSKELDVPTPTAESQQFKTDFSMVQGNGLDFVDNLNFSRLSQIQSTQYQRVCALSRVLKAPEGPPLKPSKLKVLKESPVTPRYLSVRRDRAPPLEDFGKFPRKNSLAENKYILQAQLDSLIEAANKRFAKPHRHLYKSLSPETVNTIVTMCETLSANLQTIFRTIELYDRFVIGFNKAMYKETKDMSEEEIKELRIRIGTQAPLRLCSCILLASKLHGDTSTPSVSVNKVKLLLSKCGLTFKREAIIRSEMRVLEYLQFEMGWVTPFEIVEQIISLLNFPTTELRQIYHFSMLLLEYAYVDHHQIFEDAWKAKKYSDSRIKDQNKNYEDLESEREEFRRSVIFNIPLRAASIVACACWIIDPNDVNRICEEISSLVCISASAIFDLASQFMSASISPSK